MPDFYQQNDLIQKDLKNIATIDVWPGGIYAQTLHKGKYIDEGPTVETLHSFIESNRVDIKDVLSPHEEEYLTSQDAKEVKTIIRYRIK